MKKTYSFDYEESPNELTYCTVGSEKLSVSVHEGQVFIFGNPSGLTALGRLMIQIAESRTPDGFHVHIPQDFDVESADAVCVGIDNEAPANLRGPMVVKATTIV